MVLKRRGQMLRLKAAAAAPWVMMDQSPARRKKASGMSFATVKAVEVRAPCLAPRKLRPLMRATMPMAIPLITRGAAKTGLKKER
jgi:hypothetical protein